jgi:AraC family transcriptional regulator
MLITHPKDTITTIALACGFSGSAAFARAFSEHFGMSASAFRRRGRKINQEVNLGESKIGKEEGKIGKTESKTGKAFPRTSHYIDERNIKAKGRIDMTVEIKEEPDLHVAYCRHVGAYQEVGEAFERLLRWAGPRGLLQFPKTQVLGVYHDDPEITDVSKLRSSACITVPEGTEVDGEIGTMAVPGGKFAVAHFEVKKGEFKEAWDELTGRWMPGSGYQPDDRPCYELYLNDAKDHPEGKFIVDLYMPVKPL